MSKSANNPPYLLQLALRLADGATAIDENRVRKHRKFILSQQQSDGGFSGREGESDLYYTGFAVRCLMMLGGLTEQDANRIGACVRRGSREQLSVIDLLSWMFSALVVQMSGGDDVIGSAPPDFEDKVVATLEAGRVADGGYAKTTQGAAGSTYHSFLVALTYELLGQQLPETDKLVSFLLDRRRDDGGFVEIAPMKRSGTNPTAAGVALLRMLGAMDDTVREDVLRFLSDVRSAEGGFQANTRIPFADGLSTFTGLLTAFDLGGPDIIDSDRVRRYATDCLELADGGFRGASWDEQADVEYTFYGLGILALLGHPK